MAIRAVVFDVGSVLEAIDKIDKVARLAEGHKPG